MGVGKTEVPKEFGQLAAAGRGMIKQTAKPRKLIFQQLTEALRTGGVKAKIPMIQQAVSASRQAMAGGLQQTAEQLASRNIGGPFASRILAGTRLLGEQATGAIPTQMAQQIIQQAMPFVSATQSLGAGTMGQAGQAEFASNVFNNQQFRQFMGDLKDAMMGAGKMAACLHPDTPIETPDGDVLVSKLVPGDQVWSQDAQGNRIVAEVEIAAKRNVKPTHSMLLILGHGGSFYVSSQHPMPDGTPIEHTFPIANRAKAVEVGTLMTHDIAVTGPTGVYFVRGVALGSTLDERFRRSLR